MTVIYDKLVRDKIPEIILAKGEQPITRKLEGTDYRIELIRKLSEEVDEYKKDNNAEELADILEVIYALADDMNISLDEVEKIRKEKLLVRGGFKDKIFLIEVK